MANFNGKLPKLGDSQAGDLGKVLIGILAIGLAGGMALIEAAKKVGDEIIEGKKDTK